MCQSQIEFGVFHYWEEKIIYKTKTHSVVKVTEHWRWWESLKFLMEFLVGYLIQLEGNKGPKGQVIQLV